MKESLVEKYGYSVINILSLEFRNDWDIRLGSKVGKSYVDTTYSYESGSDVSFVSKGINFSLGSGNSGIFGFSISNNLNHSYNWLADHLGYQLRSRFFFFYSPIKYFILKSSISITGFWEEGTALSELFSTRKLEDIYVVASPRLEFRFTTSIDAEINTEFTYLWSEGRVIQSHINPLLRWMVSPKSWLYLVYSKKIGKGKDYLMNQDIPSLS